MRLPHTFVRAAAAALLAAAAGAALAQGAATTVEVFANSAMNITPTASAGLPYQLTVFRLDAMHNVEAQLNQQLPQSEAEAQHWVAENQARITRQIRPVARATAEGITRAVRYRINRLPAIVINRSVVVYGVTDVNQAIALAQQNPPEVSR